MTVRCGFAWFALATIVAPVSIAAAQPANDECIGATPTVAGLAEFDLTGATNSVQTPCDDDLVGPVPDVWFDFLAPHDGVVIVSTCALPISGPGGTTLAAYDACGNAELACNTSACEFGQSKLNFAVSSGLHYKIRVASVDQSELSGQFRIIFVAACTASAPGAPANDCCASATSIGDGTFLFTTVGATRDSISACDDLNPNGDVWFAYTAPTTGFSKIRPAADAPTDLGIAVLDGGCNGDVVACGTDFLFEGEPRQVVFPTAEGHLYLIRLQGISSAEVSGHIVVATAVPPANDNCDTADEISGLGTFAYDNTLADNSGPDDSPACDFPVGPFPSAGIAHDVWFRWTNTLPAGMDAVVSTCNTQHVDTKIAVYADGCPVGTPIICNDDACFLWAEAVFTPTPGATYLIRIGVWPGAGAEPAPDGRPNSFEIRSQPTCIVTAPPGALMEPEACGDHTNDGPDFDCLTAGLFTDVSCGTTTIFGTAPVVDDVPDQDMYRAVLPVASHVKFSGSAEFPMMLGIFDDQCPANLYVRWRFPSHPCDDAELNPLEIDLDPGTWVFAVVNTANASACGEKNHYLVTITIDSCCALAGDLNCDCHVNNFDIDPFVQALIDPEAYQAAFPTCTPLRGDVNADNAFNNFDIDPFVACIVALPADGQPCPAP